MVVTSSATLYCTKPYPTTHPHSIECVRFNAIRTLE